MGLNELMDKDTANMETEALEKHVGEAILAAYKTIMQKAETYEEICKPGRWGGDNQATGVRAGVMALYQQHIKAGILEIKAKDGTTSYTVSPNRKNPINRGAAHSFDGAELCNWANYRVPKMEDLIFSTNEPSNPDLDESRKRAGRRFLDAYTVMMQQMGGGYYTGGSGKYNSFSSYFMKIDNTVIYGDHIYNHNYGNDADKTAYEMQKSGFTAYTTALSKKPNIDKITSLKEFILSDLIKDTVFVSLIDLDNDKARVCVTGNKSLLHDYWNGFQAKNHDRLREEFISETNNLVLGAMTDAAEAEKLGKVV